MLRWRSSTRSSRPEVPSASATSAVPTRPSDRFALDLDFFPFLRGFSSSSSSSSSSASVSSSSSSDSSSSSARASRSSSSSSSRSSSSSSTFFFFDLDFAIVEVPPFLRLYGQVYPPKISTSSWALDMTVDQADKSTHVRLGIDNEGIVGLLPSLSGVDPTHPKFFLDELQRCRILLTDSNLRVYAASTMPSSGAPFPLVEPSDVAHHRTSHEFILHALARHVKSSGSVGVRVLKHREVVLSGHASGGHRLRDGD